MFRTQGAVDHEWLVPNVMNMTIEPPDGIYEFVSTVQINEEQAKSSLFEIEFRCDYWASGSFRVRNVRIEKGPNSMEWSPGL